MANLTAANQARLEKSLNKLYNFNGSVMTLEKFLQSTPFRIVEMIEPKYEYNRRKFNSMNYTEQAAYERKLEEKVTRYYAERIDNGFLISLPKIVADHYKEQA